MSAFDIIGDIHGQSEKLESLLRYLGYREAGCGYLPPVGRQAVFLGDLIDRGPGQQRVLTIVRSMVESGNALCVMGNHEFNAIGYLTPDPNTPGENLRPNLGCSEKSLRNRRQHAEFLNQIGENSAAHFEWVEWFKTLPPFLDLDGIRVAHACWNDSAVQTLIAGGWDPAKALDDDLLVKLHAKNTPLERARKLITCGLEIPLPAGRYIEGKDGGKHYEVRVANWRYLAEKFAQVALVPNGQTHQLEGMEWPAELVISEIVGAPVFIGHHWFTGPPTIESEKLACLDWSAAARGPLVAYRWDGESTLSDDKLEWVDKTG